MSRAGFTMVESAVGAALLGGVLLVIGFALDTSFSAYRLAETESRLDAAAHRALNQIVDEIADAGAGTLGADTGVFGSTTLSFRRAALYDAEGEAMTWGTETQIAWRMEDGEVDDDADNDGDGLIDEGEVFWIYDVGEANQRTATRIRGVPQFLEGEVANLADDNGNGLVDEAGLDFEWDGSVLTVRLTLAAVGPRGVQLTRTVQTATRLRN